MFCVGSPSRAMSSFRLRGLQQPVVWGVDAASVRKWREDIVHLSLSAYGQDGPMSDQPGYDPLMQAYSGIISVTGQPDGVPTRVGGSVVDFGTGMWAAISVLAALRERDRSGCGAALEASLMDTSLAWVSYHMMGVHGDGTCAGADGVEPGRDRSVPGVPDLGWVRHDRSGQRCDLSPPV